MTEEMSFYVIDEKGNQFFFKPGDIEEKEYKIEESDSTSRMVPTKWVLDRVVTYKGMEIKYKYQLKYVSYKAANQEKVTEYFSTGGVAPPNIDYSADYYIWKGYVSQLSKIEYANGVTATFHWDTSASARCDLQGSFVVDSITIESRYDEVVNNSITYKFNYAYFHTPNMNNSSTEVAHRVACNTIESGVYSSWEYKTTRLKLKSIDRIGNDHIAKENYHSFDYHETPLPVRFSKQKDFYGYYNNGYTETTYPISGIPRHTYNNNYGVNIMIGTDRTPDTTSALTYLQACLLKKITNGLGGTSEITYQKPVLTNTSCGYRQSNYYSDFGTSATSGCSIDPDLEGQDATDGLVVTSVVMKDGFSPDNEKRIEYSYSGGERFYKGGYFWYPTKVKGNTIKEREYCNTMVSAPMYFKGSNHGFSEVTVTEKNHQTQEQLSKVKYTFSNLFLPNPLTELFTQEYADSVVPAVSVNWRNFYYETGLKPAPGLSCIDQVTGPTRHTMPPSYMEKFMMGLLKTVTKYDQQNNIIYNEVNKYDLNFKNIEGVIKQREYRGRTFYYDNVNDDFSFASKGFKMEYIGYAVNHVEPRVRYKKASYFSGGNEQIIEYKYNYDNIDNLKSVTWTDSKSDTYRKEYYYTYDYQLYDTCLKTSLQHIVAERTLKIFPSLPSYDRVIHHKAYASISSVQKGAYRSDASTALGGGVWFIVRNTVPSQYYPYEYIETRKYLPKIQFPSIYESTLDEPITINDANADESSAITGNVGLNTLKKIKKYSYDSHNNVLEVQYNEQDKFTSYIWDSRINMKIAEVSNARRSEIAYTSFEGFTRSSTNPDDYGNWIFDTTYVKYDYQTMIGKVPTGRYCYELSTGNAPLYCILPSMPSGIPEPYIVSVWCHHEPLIIYGPSNDTVDLEAVTPIIQGGWRMYQGIVYATGYYQELHIKRPASVTTYVDEVRLYPGDALMSTQTYEPLYGVSSTCDARSNIRYYEYDKQGRVITERNMYGKVKLKREIVNQKPDNN